MNDIKQIKECLNRAFEGKKPLSKKWKAVISEEKLVLTHYQHLVLVYDLKENTTIYWWYDKPADKRGLVSALQYLEEDRMTS